MVNRLLTTINSLDRVLTNLLKPAVVALGLFCAFAMVGGIAARELFSTPLLGLEELVLIAVMWLYMLGAALASKERSHLSGDFVQVVTRKPHIIAVFKLFATIISFGLAIIITVWSYSLFSWGFVQQQSTPVFRIPLYAAQCSLFVCSLFFIFYGARDLLTDFNNVRHAFEHQSSNKNRAPQKAYMNDETT